MQCTLFALLFVTNVYGAPEGYNDTGDAPKLLDRVKFGVGFCKGLGVGSPIITGFPESASYNSLDIFGEYKINDEIGVRLSVQPTYLQEAAASGNIEMKSYVKIAPTLRVYVGKDKQFCLFFSPQMGYLLSAKQKSQDYNGKEEVLNYFVAKDLEEIKGKDYEVNRRARGTKFGWDYECKNGLIIGGIFTSEWATENPDTTKKGNPGSSSSAKKLDLLFLQGQQVLYLGYNFAKLFD
jgi:hypothetical protein